jgi:hypothetical protein
MTPGIELGLSESVDRPFRSWNPTEAIPRPGSQAEVAPLHPPPTEAAVFDIRRYVDKCAHGPPSDRGGGQAAGGRQ